MSSTGDHGSWNPYGNDGSDHGTSGQAPQDPWAQHPAPQDPYGQPSAGSASDPYGQGPVGQDPYAQPSPGSASDPYGQSGAAAPQYGQQDPYAQPSAGSASDLYGQPSAGQDPFAPPSAGSASDPYAQGQQNWAPAAGSGAPASDPYGAPAEGPAPHGQNPYAQPAGGPAPQGQAQSRLVVGLLGIFLGGFGVHRFLLGYTTIGLIQVLVSVLSCFTLYPFIQIWGLIEGIMVLAKSPTFERDAHGRPLTD